MNEVKNIAKVQELTVIERCQNFYQRHKFMSFNHVSILLCYPYF